ncbi:MAG: glycosyltransferase [Hyphomonadaceae bacterium]
MHTFVVVPCLNEGRLIERTTQSLGFGANSPTVADDTKLVLVDNGSTDDTWMKISAVRDVVKSGAVIIAREEERGYVPPRHRGALIALEFASKRRIPPEEVLVLQADADTIYEPGYVEAMRSAASTAGPNHIVEGGTHSPRRFLHDHPGFQELADLIDAQMEPHFVSESDDVVVDDKVAGYRLSDYLRWGGHRRDFMSTGAEVHAETTRLFIRARSYDARKVHVDDAWASPSRRKIQRNPIRHFATAGFPRENTWWRAWNARYSGPRTLGAFESPQGKIELSPAIAMRRAHLLVLFTTIPTLVAASLKQEEPERGPRSPNEAAALRCLDEGQLGRFFEMLLPGPML